MSKLTIELPEPVMVRIRSMFSNKTEQEITEHLKTYLKQLLAQHEIKEAAMERFRQGKEKRDNILKENW